LAVECILRGSARAGDVSNSGIMVLCVVSHKRFLLWHGCIELIGIWDDRSGESRESILTARAATRWLPSSFAEQRRLAACAHGTLACEERQALLCAAVFARVHAGLWAESWSPWRLQPSITGQPPPNGRRCRDQQGRFWEWFCGRRRPVTGLRDGKKNHV